MPNALTKGLFRNMDTGAEIDTDPARSLNFAGTAVDSLGNPISGDLSADNLKNLGFEQLESQAVDGGQLFTGAGGFQKFVQDPNQAGKNTFQNVDPSGVIAGRTIQFTGPDGNTVDVEFEDYDTMKNLSGAGYKSADPDFQPDITPDVISTDSVFEEASALDSKIGEQRDLLAAEQASLRTQTEELIKGIEADAVASQEAIRASQEEERKTEKAIQFRLGQSGTAYGLDQIRRSDLARKAELQGILDKKQALISKARQASSDDNIKLLKEYTKNINDLDEQYFQRQRQQQQDRINEYVKLSTEERAQRKEITDFAKADREDTQTEVEKMAVGGVTSDELTDSEKSDIEQTLGLLPGTFAPYYDKLVLAQQAKEQKDEITFQKSVMDMLAMVPEGEVIQIGDSLYEGTEQPDIYTVKEEDASGNVTAVGIDKITGEKLWEQNLGRIGKGFKAAGGGTPALNAGDLYSGQINSLIRDGETNVDNIVFGLQQFAYDSGTNLSVKDLNAIRSKAQELVALGGTASVGGNVESDFTPKPNESGWYFDESGNYVQDKTLLSDEDFIKSLGIGDYTIDSEGNVIEK